MDSECERHSTEWPRIREQQAILEICEVPKTRKFCYLCNMITDSLSKAETQFPKIKPLHISENGVFMLLDRIDVSKSSGPDKLPGRLLQSLAKEITPVVHFIFT